MEPEVIIAATLGPLVMLLVQAIKSLVPNMGQKAIPLTMVFATLFGLLLVDFSLSWQMAMLQLSTYILEIAGVASGVYSWKPKDVEVTLELPDYSDEK